MELEIVTIFIVTLCAAMFIDNFAHRKDKPVSLLSASLWSVFWIAVAMAFGAYLHFRYSPEMASLFFTGYALEKALSVDNLFVIMAVFSWFAIPDKLRHRVLFWGIVGAIVFRGIFVAIGTSLLYFGPWVEVLFAAIVIYTGIIMLKSGDDDDEIEDYSSHPAYRFIKKIMPVWPRIYENKFIIKRDIVEKEYNEKAPEGYSIAAKGKFFATPLLLCLAVIELSDVMFAFDSVPAVIAVSKDPVIIYSAMMFAILGLRSLYFVLESMKQYLVHLEKAVIFLLFYIGGKLALNATDKLFGHGIHIDPTSSLYVVLAILSVGILASFVFPEKDEVKDTGESNT